MEELRIPEGTVHRTPVQTSRVHSRSRSGWNCSLRRWGTNHTSTRSLRRTFRADILQSSETEKNKWNNIVWMYSIASNHVTRTHNPSKIHTPVFGFIYGVLSNVCTVSIQYCRYCYKYMLQRPKHFLLPTTVEAM